MVGTVCSSRPVIHFNGREEGMDMHAFGPHLGQVEWEMKLKSEWKREIC